MSDRKTSIQVTAGTLERLKALGRKGETYEEIIVRLLALAEAGQ